MIFYNLGWGMRLLKDFVSRKTTCLCFFGPYYHFSAFFRIKKDAPWHFAKIGPSFSPWTPIFDHFVQFLIMSVPKQPPLKLKSEKQQNWYRILTGCQWNRKKSKYIRLEHTRLDQVNRFVAMSVHSFSTLLRQ